MRFILVYSVLLSVYLNYHEFHVSIMDMEHNAQTKSVEVSQRIFIDDLETALKAYYDLEKVDTYKPDNQYYLDSLIDNYLKSKVIVIIDNEEKSFNYIGSELEGDARWCYYEIEEVAIVKEIKITNVALMDVFEDQQNIVHFKNNKKMKSYKLDIDTKSTLFKF